MVREIKDIRTTYNEAAKKYANDYILMRMDNSEPECDTGVLLYVGERDGMYSLLDSLEDKNNCFLFNGESLNDSLGGIELDF